VNCPCLQYPVHFLVGGDDSGTEGLVVNDIAVGAEEQPCLVADVFTDSLYGTVRHVATAPLYPILVIWPDVPDNPGMVSTGLVMSYHEFALTDIRLTDKQWQRWVRRGKHQQYRPPFVRSFLWPP